MITAKVSERGQISIPAAARKKLGIKPNSKVQVEVRDQEIAIKPIQTISDVCGIFHKYAEGKTTDWKIIRAETMKRVAKEIAND
jgi:AbrB family looped-hinge helix DNA binding protein